MDTVREKKVYFVTSSDIPFFPGRGGTEAFTFSHIRELRRRGVDARLVTVGLQEKDGRDLVPDIPFLDVADEKNLSDLDATLVGMCRPFVVKTKKPSFIMAHVPPDSSAYDHALYKKSIRKHGLIANSQFTRRMWAQDLQLASDSISVVYPFADPAFAKVARKQSTGDTRVLFAGRLHINKGIYLFLEALHHDVLKTNYSFTAIDTGSSSSDTRLIAGLIKQHPRIKLATARQTPELMAALMAEHDIVVIPSNHYFWHEAFGMVSVEAQHAGCRVVAADTGGLPETNIGGLHLFEPGNSLALANTIEQARFAGPLPAAARKQANTKFTVAQSVDSLLDIVDKTA